MKPTLRAALIFSVLATACTPVTPPTPTLLQRVDVRPEVATCGTVTWTLTFTRHGLDVTGDVRYALVQSPDATVSTPRFTLTPSANGLTGAAVQATGQAGMLLSAEEFATHSSQTFTCDRTGQNVTVKRTLTSGPGGTNPVFPTITLSYAGALHAD